MAKIYLGNAFSLQMLLAPNSLIKVQEVFKEDIPTEAESIVGHADTATVLTTLLGREIPANRKSITLFRGDILFVSQIMGGRLPEGATTLPKDFSIKFFKVSVLNEIRG